MNIFEIEDDLDGNWWHYIRSKDLGFLARIDDLKDFMAEEDDILIHKQVKEGERFPSVRYHQIMDGEAFLIDGKDARNILANQLLQYISAKNLLPFGCKYVKVQRNGLGVINYNPTGQSTDNFQLKFSIESLPLEENGQELNNQAEYYLQELNTEEENPLSGESNQEYTIKPITEDGVIENIAMESGKNSVFVIGAEIHAINLRKSYYMANETIFYLIRVQGGEAAPENKKGTLRRNFGAMNVKCSQKAMEKFELEVGDTVTFNGKLKNDQKLKLIVQNVRKFEKL